MARPRKFDREEAIDVVMNSFWRDGIKDCSVKALSEQLNITRSSFYNTFGNQAALFREVMQRYGSDPKQSGLYSIDRDESLKVGLSTYFEDLCRARADDPEHRGCLVTNCLAELLPGETEMATFVSEMAEGGLQILAQRIERAVEVGELPNRTEARALSRSVHSLLFGTNLLSKVEHDGDRLWETCKSTLEALELYDPSNEL